MGTHLSEKESQLYTRVDEVLHYIWDPIGVSGVPQARDEYYSYVPAIFSLVKSSSRAEEIAIHLRAIETDRMGLSGNMEKDLEVANILLGWRDSIYESAL